MFAAKDRKQQPDKLVSASKSRGQSPRDFQKQPLDSLQLLQRSLGNQYLQALSQTAGQPDGSIVQREDEGRMLLQPKLVVGAANDIYEQEADRVAERIMQMPELSIQRRTLGMAGSCEFENCENQLDNFFMIPEDGPPGFYPSGGASFRVNDVDGFWFRFHTPRDEWYKIPDISTAQVTCNNEDKEHPTISSIFGDWTNKGIHTPNPFQGAEATQEQEEELQRKPMEDEEKKKEEEETLQTKTASSKLPAVSSSLQNQITALQGGGQPLPQSGRNFFEPRFGANFSQVRVHTDSTADTLNRTLNARAFTTGQDIFFRQGEYDAGSLRGKELLAHELTHVVQQTGRVRAKLNIAHMIDSSIIQRTCQYFPTHTDPDTYCETAEEARANITQACPPYRDDFLYQDGPTTHRWRPIPGYGCAHHVAHILGISNGPAYARCRGRFSVKIDQITQGRSLHPLAQAQINDIWLSGGGVHSGVVKQVDATVPRVRVDQCGIGGNAQLVWYNYGNVFR